MFVCTGVRYLQHGGVRSQRVPAVQGAPRIHCDGTSGVSLNPMRMRRGHYHKPQWKPIIVPFTFISIKKKHRNLNCIFHELLALVLNIYVNEQTTHITLMKSINIIQTLTLYKIIEHLHVPTSLQTYWFHIRRSYECFINCQAEVHIIKLLGIYDFIWSEYSVVNEKILLFHWSKPSADR